MTEKQRQAFRKLKEMVLKAQANQSTKQSGIIIHQNEAQKRDTEKAIKSIQEMKKLPLNYEEEYERHKRMKVIAAQMEGDSNKNFLSYFGFLTISYVVVFLFFVFLYFVTALFILFTTGSSWAIFITLISVALFKFLGGWLFSFLRDKLNDWNIYQEKGRWLLIIPSWLYGLYFLYPYLTLLFNNPLSISFIQIITVIIFCGGFILTMLVNFCHNKW